MAGSEGSGGLEGLEGLEGSAEGSVLEGSGGLEGLEGLEGLAEGGRWRVPDGFRRFESPQRTPPLYGSIGGNSPP